MDIIFLLTALFAESILVSAAVSDLRTREISDAHWYLLLLGIPAILVSQGLESRLDVLLAQVQGIFVFATIIWEDTKFRIIQGAIGAQLMFLSYNLGREDLTLLSFQLISLWMILIFVLYELRIVQGGADAKCLMAISMVFPFYAE